MPEHIFVRFPQLVEAFEFIKGEYAYFTLPGSSQKADQQPVSTNVKTAADLARAAQPVPTTGTNHPTIDADDELLVSMAEFYEWYTSRAPRLYTY